MDIERTMEFIVENLAAVTVRRQRTEGCLEALAASQQKTDQSIRGLRTIMQTGMRILVKLEQNRQHLDTKIAALADGQIRTEESLVSLAAAQKRTDQKFERWLKKRSR